MNKIQRTLAYAMFLTLMSVALLAQSPFDGTWRVNLDKSKPSPKPVELSVKNGMYDCFSCSPKIHVKADGQDQAVTGQPFDTISVREVDSKSIAETRKKGGKITTELHATVSNDGNTTTVKQTFHPKDNDQPVTWEGTFKRVGKGPPGAHATSGSWQINKVVSESENGRTATFKMAGDELSFSDSTGESFTAKLDGKDYPMKGVYGSYSVSLKSSNDHTLELTYKRDGKIVSVSKMTVSADGGKMTETETDRMTGRTSTYVSEKQ